MLDLILLLTQELDREFSASRAVLLESNSNLIREESRDLS